MVFTKRLRDGVRHGRIRCSIRIWKYPHVKVGGRYPMDEGHIVVDSIERITLTEVTNDLARESGFESVEDLLQTAKHGHGRKLFLIPFHSRPPGRCEERKGGNSPRGGGALKQAPPLPGLTIP